MNRVVSRTAAPGSSASMMARTMAIPATPVWLSSAVSTVCTSPIAITGRVVAATRGG